ncbi:hypothetical protein PRIPAC_84631 [Pristionchus pacificus]|uniref:Hydrolase n=1 Tax=Pristionchus pacificus TaxID=54126 RepID=A0A2A6BN51_PRIPA|nr:hypothetical protein PRIPAC_84631 [Pristionchus pacificus]|eukprot:PDM67236.1 hydrolase [Pristionchus pacificus]
MILTVLSFVSEAARYYRTRSLYYRSLTDPLRVSPLCATVVSKRKMSIKLVIFDKDGTLVDFHSMWIPWARATVALLEKEAGISCGAAVYKTLGVCPLTSKVSMGALAEKTLLGIREDVSKTLQSLGISQERADEICPVAVPEAVEGGVTRPVCDLPTLFEALAIRGVRSAVCTADSRRATVNQLDMLGIAPYMDLVVCGNDQGIIPKPSPHCAIQICKKLGVELNEALMVGDTVADVKMGRVAGLRASVACEDVSELPILIDKLNEDMKRG